MLAGASVVSFSMWVRVNPNCNVAEAGGVRAFGDGAGRFSVLVSGTGTVRVAWSPMGAGSLVGSSGFSRALTPGTTHHLAATWQGGLQRYFIDGQVVATDDQQGPLGNPGGPSAPFRLGSDSAGVDLTVDEPTLWVGYALTGTDVVGLRDRLVSAAAIAPSSLVLDWPLSGADGVAAKPGDPGLADRSSSGLALGTVVGSAPTYVGGDLVYAPPTQVAVAKVTTSGTMIAVQVADPAGNPVDIASLKPTGDVQVLTLSGEPAGGNFTLGFAGQVTTPIAVADTPPKVSATWTYSSLTAGTPYYIRVAFDPFANNSTAALVEVFALNADSSLGARLQVGTVDLTQNLAVTGDYLAYYGQPFISVVKTSSDPGSIVPITPPGTSIAIRMTGPAGQNITMKNVMCSPHGPSVLTLQAGPPAQYTDPADVLAFYQNQSTAVYSAGFNGSGPASGSGDIYAVTGGAPAIQAALLALPGGVIPAGAVTVSGSVSGTGPDPGPFLVRFVGPLGGVAQPTIVSSSPQLTVIHDDTSGSAIGGQYPSIAVDGGAPVTLSSVLWGAGLPDANGNRTYQAYSPWLIYPLPGSMTIAPTSSVTFSAPSGYCVSTAGPTATLKAIPVTNPATILPAFPAVSKTMQVGYNIQGENYFTSGRVYANIAHGTGIGSPFPTMSGNGYPTSLPTDSTLMSFADYYQDTGGANKGANCFPQGRYRILWDGSVTLRPFLGATTTANQISSNLTGTTDNERVIEFRDTANFGPAFSFYIETLAHQNADGSFQASPDGTFPCNLQTLRIYPPDPADPTGNTPWADPPKYYPTLLSQFGAAHCFRTMNALNTNDSNVVNYDDMMTRDWLSYSGYSKIYSAPIARIENYTGDDKFFGILDPNTMLVTTSTPHGFVDGHEVLLTGPVGTLTTTNSSQSQSLTNYPSQIRVLSPTTFLITSPFGSQGGRMNNVLTPTGATATVTVSGGGIPFQDCVDLANTLNCDLWLNIPALANDDCVARMAAYVVANLNPNLKAHVEYANECWNYGFSQWYYLVGMGNANLGTGGDDYATYQVYRSAQVHAIFTAAFASAGQPATRLRRVIGTSPGAGGTQAIINAMTAIPYSINGVTTTVDLTAGTSTTSGVPGSVTFTPVGPIEFDEIATSGYVDNSAFNEPSLAPIIGGLTYQQDLDLFELYIVAGQMAAIFDSHVAAVQASSLAVKPELVLYECGLDMILPLTSVTGDFTQTPNQGAKTHEAQFHPRMAQIMLGLLQQWQDSGVTLANIFYLNGGNGYAAWNTYFGCSMLAGTGAEAGATNVSDPTDIPNVRSVVGSAINQWLTLTPPMPPAPSAPSAPKPPKAASRIIPGRSVRPRAVGYKAW